MNEVQYNAINFLMNVACIMPVDEKTFKSIWIGFNLDGPEMKQVCLHVAEQCYAGLNKSCGDWAMELVKYAIQEC